MYDDRDPRPTIRALSVLGRPLVLLAIGLLAATLGLGSFLLFGGGATGPTRVQLVLVLVAVGIYVRLSFKSAWG